MKSTKIYKVKYFSILFLSNICKMLSRNSSVAAMSNNHYEKKKIDRKEMSYNNLHVTLIAN